MAKRNWSTERYQLIARPRTGFKESGAMFFTLVQMAEIYANGAHSANGGAKLVQMVHMVQRVKWWCKWCKLVQMVHIGANLCKWRKLVQIGENGVLGGANWSNG